MTWEYLYDKMDFRVWLIAGYLKGKTDGKIIFDINGMHCPLLKYIKDDYLSYISNDIQDVFPTNYPRCMFFQQTDDRMMERLGDVDILVAIGIGGHEITNAPQESPTVTQSIKDIILKKKPEIVILEAVVGFRSILDEIVGVCGEYRVAHDIKIEAKKDWVFNRNLIILEKNV